MSRHAHDIARGNDDAPSGAKADGALVGRSGSVAGRLDEVLAEHLLAIEAGGTPDRAELLLRNPDLALELEAFFADDDRARQLAGAGAAEITNPLTTAASDLRIGGAPAGAAGDVPQIAGYDVLGPLGQGGMGVVWRAVQLSTHREVALKLMNAAYFGSTKGRLRFDREVELTAKLQHPHVARVYDSGLRQGVYFYAMELVEGGVPLDQYVRQRALPRRATLALAKLVCEAVQHAHQRGVIHRDLKPGNILVDKEGNPKVLDFGLAKAMQETASAEDGRADAAEASVSIDGEIAGTPAYMSPEQALGRPVDTRTDVYSLGVILYRLLIGASPHDLSGSRPDVMRRIATDEVTRPRKADPKLDRELEALLLKALAREPDRRYASAVELAKDIGNYLGGEPLSAKSPTTAYFLRKRVAKYRVPVSIAAGVLLAFAAVGLYSVRQVYRARRIADANAVRADRAAVLAGERAEALRKQGMETTRRLRDGLASEGRALVEAERYSQAKERFAQSIAESARLGEPPLRADLGLLVALTAAPDPLNVIPIDAPSASNTAYTIPVRAATITPDGRRALVATGEAFAAWDLVSGASVQSFPGHDDLILALAASGDGRLVASAGREGLVKLWDPRTGKELRVYREHSGAVRAVALSRDGRVAVSGGDDMVVRIWDTATGDTLRAWEGNMSPITAIAIAPDASWAVSGSEAGRVELWAAEGRSEHYTLSTMKQRIEAASFSSDGRHVAIGYWEMIRGWDVATRKQVRDVRVHKAGLRDIAFVPGSALVIASASADSTVQLTNLTTGGTVRVFEDGHKAWAKVGISADGLHLVSVASNPTIVHHWSLRTPRDAAVLAGHPGMIWGVAVSPVAPLAASFGAEPVVLLWDLPSGQPVGRIATASGIGAVQFSPEGRRLLVGTDDGFVRVWDVASGRQVGAVEHGGSTGVGDVAWSPDGRRVLSRSGVIVRAWDVATGQQVCRVDAPPGTRFDSVVFWAGGEQILTGGNDGWLRLADAATGATLRTVGRQEGAIASIAAAPDGRTACAGGDSVVLWDVPTGREIRRFVGHTAPVISVAISPNGALAATGSKDRSMGVWEVASGQELLNRTSIGDMWVTGVDFSHDGAYLIAGGHDAKVRRWDLTRPSQDRASANAVAAARAALRRQADDPAALSTLGEWYAFRGAGDLAIELLERGRLTGAKNSNLTLARCYWEMGNLVAARRELAVAAERGEAPADYLRTCLGATAHQAYGGAPAAIPSTIRGEAFDDGPEGEAYHSGASLAASAAPGVPPNAVLRRASTTGANGVGAYLAPDDWLAYTLEAGAAGTYDVAVRGALYRGTVLRIEIVAAVDGTRNAFELTADAAGWQTLVEPRVPLRAGRHVMRVRHERPLTNVPSRAIATRPTTRAALRPAAVPTVPATAAIPPALVDWIDLRPSGASAAGPLARAGPRMDLMPLVDVNQNLTRWDPIFPAGEWWVEDGQLFAAAGGRDSLEIPYEPPREYDFVMEFTRLSGSESITQQLTGGGSLFEWVMGGWGNHYAGFQNVAGRSAAENASQVRYDACLENGRRYTSVIEVRDDGVSAYIDGFLVSRWTKYRELGPRPPRRNLSWLGVRPWHSGFVFHRLEVVEISGAGRALQSPRPLPATRPSRPPATRPALIAFGPIGSAVRAGRVRRTAAAGGTKGDAFEDVPADGAILSGFVLATNLGPNGTARQVCFLRPIYRASDGRRLGPPLGTEDGPLRTIEARDGYAVGAVIVRADDRLRGMRPVFMRMTASGLDPTDTYEGDSVGVLTGDTVRLGGDGRPVVGIFGGAVAAIDSFGLVQLGPASSSTPRPNTGPSTRPETGPSTRPETRPSTRPSTPFRGTIATVPGRIEAEDFDEGDDGAAFHIIARRNPGKSPHRGSQVFLDNCRDADGGYNVGGVKAGEWLAYTVNVKEAGLYDLELRLSSPGGGGTLHLSGRDGRDLTGVIVVPDTGEWQKWQTTPGGTIRLDAGRQTLRVHFDKAGSRGSARGHVGNLNWIRFTKK